MSSVAIGLDLGGTQIKGVVATWTGDILRREVRATNDDGTDSKSHRADCNGRRSHRDGRGKQERITQQVGRSRRRFSFCWC